MAPIKSLRLSSRATSRCTPTTPCAVAFLARRRAAKRSSSWAEPNKLARPIANAPACRGLKTSSKTCALAFVCWQRVLASPLLPFSHWHSVSGQTPPSSPSQKLHCCVPGPRTIRGDWSESSRTLHRESAITSLSPTIAICPPKANPSTVCWSGPVAPSHSGLATRHTGFSTTLCRATTSGSWAGSRSLAATSLPRRMGRTRLSSAMHYGDASSIATLSSWANKLTSLATATRSWELALRASAGCSRAFLPIYGCPRTESRIPRRSLTARIVNSRCSAAFATASLPRRHRANWQPSPLVWPPLIPSPTRSRS